MSGAVPASVCPVCLSPVPARHVTEGDETFLVKTCPDHGTFRTVVWRGEPGFSDWSRPKVPSPPKKPFVRAEKGCPLDCGLCDAHRQHTCTAVLEVTWRCDLGCPVCFASSGNGKRPARDPSLNRISHLLDRVLEASGPCNIQLSGGEPTMRDDLPEVVRLVKAKGFPFVQVNTNGLRLGREDGYARELAEAGLDSAFLQFDGTADSVYAALRGKPLLEHKLLSLDRLAEARIGVVLVPTVVPGVNDHLLGDIIRLAARRSPTVRGVHFQPVSYFGRYPESPSDHRRITLPEIMRLVEEQTGGMLRRGDFLPPGCEHSHCSFHANYVVLPDGGLKRLSASSGCGCNPRSGPEAPARPAREGADRAKAFVRRQWAGAKDLLPTMEQVERGLTPKGPDAKGLHAEGTDAEGTDTRELAAKALSAQGRSAKRRAASPPAAVGTTAGPVPAPVAATTEKPSATTDDLDAFISRAAAYTLAVSAMAFQDAWTLDFERLKGCCIHVVSPSGRLVPFCAYNLTSMTGETLYRGKSVPEEDA